MRLQVTKYCWRIRIRILSIVSWDFFSIGIGAMNNLFLLSNLERDRKSETGLSLCVCFDDSCCCAGVTFESYVCIFWTKYTVYRISNLCLIKFLEKLYISKSRLNLKRTSCERESWLSLLQTDLSPHFNVNNFEMSAILCYCTNSTVSHSMELKIYESKERKLTKNNFGLLLE